MGCVPADELRALLAAKRSREAEELVERGATQSADRARTFREAGLVALKSGEARLAAEGLRQAAHLSPGDPEPRHERGLAPRALGEEGPPAHAQPAPHPPGTT